MRIRDFFFLIVAGIALHQSASITHKMPSGWQQLAGSAIGVSGTFPFFVLLLRRMDVPEKVILRASVAFLASFLSVGIGVALGWLMDNIFGIGRD